MYYGWMILAAGTLGLVMTSPGQTYSVSIFIDHFIADLGINRSVVSTLYTIGTLLASFGLPFVGRQIDRRGPRVMVGIVSLLFACACIYMGFVQGALMLGVGFVLIRLLGQGSLAMTSSNVINRWWVQKRGTASGIGRVVGSLMIGVFPPLIHWLIGSFGWRTSYIILGLLVAAVMLPVGLIFFRRQPEDYGLLPDGAAVPEQESASLAPSKVEENWTSQEAVRTGAFWTIALGIATISMLGTGLQFHIVSIFQDNGLAAGLAAAVFVPVAITNAIANIGSGVLIDRIAVRYMLFAALLGQTATLLMAPRLGGYTMALTYGVVLGITSSLQGTVSAVVWAKYYGRKHLGSITGIASLITIGGSALGPMPMGIARDVFGSYTRTLTVLAILPLLLAGVVLFVQPPSKENSGPTA